MHTATHTIPTLFLCRPGFESALLDEIQMKTAVHKIISQGYGYIYCSLELPPDPFIFERQRLPDAGHFTLSQCKPVTTEMAQIIFRQLLHDPMPWAFQTATTIPETEITDANIEGIAKSLLRKASTLCPALIRLERKADKIFTKNHGMILQVVLSESGLFHSCAHPSQLSSSSAGGIHRMRRDQFAPSRSYLKIEEALQLLGTEPHQGELVVDLGAAPGGWSYAFAKRGCSVLAVDNGPLKLPMSLPGTITHIRSDGLTYAPPPQHRPVDWLIADMLIPPGKAIFLLKQWISNGWTRRIIMNIKIPQKELYQGLAPVEQWTKTQTAHSLRIRHLYHDRREVTVLGLLDR